jgi:hypothetical protein
VRRTLVAVGIVAVTALLTACGKAPAEAALKAADAAIEAARPEAERFVPAEWSALQDAAKAAHEKFAKGDYQGALAGAQEIPAKATDVAAAAARKKEEVTKTWADLQGSLPQMLQALTEKVGALSAMKKLPKDVDRNAVDKATEALPGITQLWQDAAQAGAAGDVMGAVTRAAEVKDRAQEMLESLEPVAPAAEAAPEK